MQRLTPMEIFNKDFKHVLRGYDIDEVNEFLDLVIQNYEEVLQENESLKKQLQSNQSVRAVGQDYEDIIRQLLHRVDRLEQLMRK